MENKEENKVEEVNPNETNKETLKKVEWKSKALVVFIVALVLIVTVLIIVLSLSKKTSGGGNGGSCDEGGKTCPLHIAIIYLNTLGLML